MNEKETDSQVDVVGAHAAMLSITEVGLGSLLHSFSIPFSGHFLSLNQTFLLSRASSLMGSGGSRFMPGSISFVAAALKSLSPAGKKLMPMLAISIQGFLYNVGILLFGHTAVGRISGAALSSVWGFLQPLVIYYTIFYQMLESILQALREFQSNWLSPELPSIWYFVSFLVLFKAIVASSLAWLAPKISSEQMAKYESKMKPAAMKRKPTSFVPQGPHRLKKVAWLAVKDMCVWPFIACVFLGGVSFWFVEGGMNTWVVMNTLRPIAIGFLLFFSIRLLPMEKLALWLERQHLGLGHAFRVALSKVREL